MFKYVIQLKFYSFIKMLIKNFVAILHHLISERKGETCKVITGVPAVKYV